MKLELITLLGQKMNEDVYEVVLPTSTGQIAVFPHHTPIVTLAIPGVISVRRKKADFDEHMEHFATNGGVVEISGDRVRILVDEADSADEIVMAESQKALERATQMKQDAKDKVELDKAQALIDRHAVRIKVAELKRRHH